MKFRVERDVLDEAISWTARSLPTRPSAPVLSGVVMKAADNTVSLGSFDYEVSSRNQFEAEVEEPGTVLVNGKILAGICKALPHKPVEVELIENRVAIRCGNTKFDLVNMVFEDYPSLPPIPEEIGLVDSNEFSRAVSQVAMASLRDETVPLLSTVRVQIKGEQLVLASTDRYRLAMRWLSWSPRNNEIETSALVKAKIFSDLAKSLGSSGEVAISLNKVPGQGALIGLEGNGRKGTCALTDGEYPDVASLFPAEAAATALVDREELGAALRRILLVADRSGQVKLTFTAEGLTLESGQGNENRAVETLPCDYTGEEEMLIAFNPSYLIDGLNALDTDLVRIAMNHATKPVVITGQNNGEESEHQDFKYLLMPIRATA